MKKRLLIGIAGGSGSGKTTLTENILQRFEGQISVLRHDDYYKSQSSLSKEERALLNYDHPDAFDTELLIQHLDQLKSGKDIDCPIYDYTVHDRSADTRHVCSTDVILLEGILIFENEELLSRMDMKIYVDTDADVRILRRIVRDMKKRERSLDSIITQYLTTVKPMHEQFVQPSRQFADIVVLEGGHNMVALEMIIQRIRGHVSG